MRTTAITATYAAYIAAAHTAYLPLPLPTLCAPSCPYTSLLLPTPSSSLALANCASSIRPLGLPAALAANLASIVLALTSITLPTLPIPTPAPAMPFTP
jgi:hypothetical protein